MHPFSTYVKSHAGAAVENTSEEPIYLPRGTDHLGFLATKLGDLLGFSTLAHELIQNAGDAPGATWLSFDVRSDALIVDNNGTFSDCQEIFERVCPWKTSQNRMCDFHRFRTVAGGDKREEADTTGAFGIGFTAVYQITDRPELVSSGRHWKVFEEQPEEKRIVQCPGCEACRGENLPGTRFILPWATDPNTELRKKLRVDPVKTETPKQLLKELLDAVPFALLFVKKLTRIRVLEDGRLVREFDRKCEGNTLSISNGADHFEWHVIRGSFSSEADLLRQAHPGKIEGKRSSEIAIAIPKEPAQDGRLWAYLPTQHHTALPFHIQADFFPKSDRKDIVLGDDFKSSWNRTAIDRAAQTFANNLTEVRDRLGAVRFWRVVTSLKSVHSEVEKNERDQVFGSFWEHAQAQLCREAVILTSVGDWIRPNEAVMLEKEEELEALPILESLGIRIVHPDLRFAQPILQSRAIGVPLLGARDLATALEALGLTRRLDQTELPVFLQNEEQQHILWREVSRLLEQLGRLNPSQRIHVRSEISKCTIAPGRDGALWPCDDVFDSDEATADLFTQVLDVSFLAHDATGFASLRSLCPQFNAASAVEELERCEPTDLALLLEHDGVPPRALIGWFEDRRSELRESMALRRKLAMLPIYPSSTGGLEPLTNLALPGGFEDSLRIAGIINVHALEGRVDFLKELGAAELTFREYARLHVPLAVQRADLPDESRRQLIQLLARDIGQLRDSADVLEALSSLPIVECQDGAFREPTEVYFGNRLTKEVLGDVPFARIPDEHAEGVRELYRWLGVAEEPRLGAIVGRVSDATSEAPTEDTVNVVQQLFDHLASRISTLETSGIIERLRSMPWLPAQGQSDRWFRPNELFADFRKYLFASQADFLNVPPRVQQRSGNFFKLLGIRENPTEQQVIGHLLECADRGEPVVENIYQFLASEASEGAVARLREQPCIHLGEGRFVQPRHVFWQPHPFGTYRWQLSESLRKYHELFSKLGVRESAVFHDATQVLYEIEAAFGSTNRGLDADTKLVVSNCWRVLTTALQDGTLDADELASLENRKLICSPNGVLQQPCWMFFDDRPNLAAKFKGLLDNNAFTKPEGMWQAMQAAGVQPLSNAVTSQLVEKVDPVESNEVTDRLREREDLIRRLLEFDHPGLAGRLPSLFDLRCFRADRLVIVQTLSVFNRERQSDPESVQAYGARNSGELYFVGRDGALPWIAISRELLMLLSPDEPPGQLALGLKEILGGSSHDAAKGVLDELQIPEIEFHRSEVQPSSGMISALGEDVIEEERDIDDDDGDSPDQHESDGDDSADLSSVEPSTPSRRAAPVYPRSSAAGGGGGEPFAGSGDGSADSDGDEDGSSPGTGGGRQASKSRPAKRRGYAVMRSYVMPDRPIDGDLSGDDGQSRRTEVDQAGINKVMQFEREQGRNPREMPPKNPGFDIESDDSEEIIERVIEVKSLSGKWEGTDAGLTKPQLEKARQLRNQYWLYVVEQALSDDYVIHRIQDPYGWANRFMFDPGWCQIEEQAESRFGLVQPADASEEVADVTEVSAEE